MSRLAVARVAPMVAASSLVACAPTPAAPVAHGPPSTRAHAVAARGRGPLAGAFIALDDLPADPADGRTALRARLDDLDRLGIGTLVVASTRRREGPGCAHPSFAWLPGFPERLGALLDDAAERDQRVVVGLVANAPACAVLDDPAVASDTRRETDAAMAALSPWTGSPAFAGWYIPDEPGLGWPSTWEHFRGVVAAIRARSAAPILASPFLARATERWSPDEVGDLAQSFRAATGVDVEVWQDSVGADGVSVAGDRPGSRGALGDYVRAISVRVGREHLWADVELFDCCGPPYTPAALARIDAQCRAADDALVARRVAWLPQVQLGLTDPARRPEAPRLRAAYAAWYGLSGRYVPAASYAWRTPPAAEYPDAGGELFDRRTGDPHRHTHPAWTGVLGTAQLRVTLPAEARVDWVSVHALRASPAGIELADALTIACDDGARRWTTPTPGDVRAREGEYVLSNRVPLAASCRTLDVTLDNSGRWTFISEVELHADE